MTPALSNGDFKSHLFWFIFICCIGHHQATIHAQYVVRSFQRQLQLQFALLRVNPNLCRKDTGVDDGMEKDTRMNGIGDVTEEDTGMNGKDDGMGEDTRRIRIDNRKRFKPEALVRSLVDIWLDFINWILWFSFTAL